MLKGQLKQKYKPIPGNDFKQAFEDSELTQSLVIKQNDIIKQGLDAMMDAKIFSSQYGNLLQYCEENKITIKDGPNSEYYFKENKRGDGGYWMHRDLK